MTSQAICSDKSVSSSNQNRDVIIPATEYVIKRIINYEVGRICNVIRIALTNILLSIKNVLMSGEFGFVTLLELY